MENTFSLLDKLIKNVRCKPGWRFYLVDEEGAKRLVISVSGHDSYNPEQPLTVSHFFPAPIATYNEKTWRRWIFEMCRRVENHELGEWFRVGDDFRPERFAHPPLDETHESYTGLRLDRAMAQITQTRSRRFDHAGGDGGRK